MAARLLRPFNIDVAHKPTCKLRSNFTKHKDKTAKTVRISTLDKHWSKKIQTRLTEHQSRSPSCDPWEGNEGSGIIHVRKPGILAKIELRIHFNGQSDSSLKRIILEPSFPSQGSQARGTRLTEHQKAERNQQTLKFNLIEIVLISNNYNKVIFWQVS
jgi:hypothetical protein